MSKKSKLYTRTGDNGKTSLYDGSRVSKTDPIIKALGNIDMLNSQVGLVLEYCKPQDELGHKLVESLIEVQNILFEIGSAIATPRKVTQSREGQGTSQKKVTEKLSQTR